MAQTTAQRKRRQRARDRLRLGDAEYKIIEREKINNKFGLVAGLLADFHVFEPANGTWTDLTESAGGTWPVARYRHGMTTAGGLIYLFGGFGGRGFARETECGIQRQASRRKRGCLEGVTETETETEKRIVRISEGLVSCCFEIVCIFDGKSRA